MEKQTSIPLKIRIVLPFKKGSLKKTHYVKSFSTNFFTIERLLFIAKKENFMPVGKPGLQIEGPEQHITTQEPHWLVPGTLA